MILKNNKLFIFTILWLILMMFLSHQPGPETADTSGVIAHFLASMLGIDVETIHIFIRHAAHIVLYGVLGLSGGLLLRRYGLRAWLALVILLLISVFDEGTKPLVVGRHCDIEDIGLNDVGVLLGFIASWLSPFSRIVR